MGKAKKNETLKDFSPSPYCGKLSLGQSELHVQLPTLRWHQIPYDQRYVTPT